MTLNSGRRAGSPGWEKRTSLEEGGLPRPFMGQTPTLHVLKEFDPDGSGTLDWEEFYGAMQVSG